MPSHHQLLLLMMKASSSLKVTFEAAQQLDSKTSWGNVASSEHGGDLLRRSQLMSTRPPHVVKPVAARDQLSCSRAARCGHPFYRASYDEESESESESESRGTSLKLAGRAAAAVESGADSEIALCEKRTAFSRKKHPGERSTPVTTGSKSQSLRESFFF